MHGKHDSRGDGKQRKPQLCGMIGDNQYDEKTKLTDVLTNPLAAGRGANLAKRVLGHYTVTVTIWLKRYRPLAEAIRYWRCSGLGARWNDPPTSPRYLPWRSYVDIG
jgi:hypothetical protein